MSEVSVMDMARSMARALGGLSAALGAIYVAMPARYAEALGCPATPKRRTTVFLVGLQELAAAAGLLATRRPTPFLWYRVAGDVIHAGMLVKAMRARDTDADRLTGAMGLATLCGITDVTAAILNQRRDRHDAAQRSRGESTYVPRSGVRAADGGRIPVQRSITVERPREAVYALWRDLANLPRFMAHLERVDVLDDRRSHWVAKAPLGASAEWDAEIVEDSPNEAIAWRSVSGDVGVSGQVRFELAAKGHGTAVRVELEYAPPGGRLGALVAKVARREPTEQVSGDLRRFKQVAEIGEILRSDATYAGGGLKQHPAQPPADRDREEA